MKILKAIGIIILSLILLLVIVSFFLPSTVHVERSVVINTDVSKPFALVNNLKEWYQWSPWHKIDSNTVWVYSEVTEGEGAWYTWKSEHPHVGSGKLTIVKSVPNEFVGSQMEFEGMGISLAGHKFEPVAEGVKVTWTLDSDGKGLPWYMVVPSKYFNLFMDKMLGPDYEKGLNNLKAASESAPLAELVAGFETTQKTIGPMILAGIREKVRTKDLTGATFGKWFEALTQAIEKEGVQPAGPAMAIYHQYGPKEVEVEAAIPVAQAGKDAGKVKYHEIAETNALVVKYFGDYNKVEPVYNAAYAYIKEKGLSSTGAPMEIYITDPAVEKDTSKWLTEIIFPLN